MIVLNFLKIKFYYRLILINVNVRWLRIEALYMNNFWSTKITFINLSIFNSKTTSGNSRELIILKKTAMVSITAKQIRSKAKFIKKLYQTIWNKTKPKQTQSKCNINLAYQHVGLISKSYITSSQYGSCNIMGCKVYDCHSA